MPKHRPSATHPAAARPTPFSQDHPARDLPIEQAAAGLPPAIERLPPAIERMVDERIEERLAAEPPRLAQRAAAQLALELRTVQSKLRLIIDSLDPEDPLDEERTEARLPFTVALEVRLALNSALGWGNDDEGIAEVIADLDRAANANAKDLEEDFEQRMREETKEGPRVAAPVHLGVRLPTS